MMSLTTVFGDEATLKASRVCRHIVALSFSELPRTRSVSDIAAKVCGSVCAAQPVTMIFACGRARRTARMVCRAWRTASAVTAQVLTTTVSVSPARSASRRMTSDSAALSRQPKVTISTLIGSGRFGISGERLGKTTVVLIFDRPGHQNMVVLFAPLDPDLTTGHLDRHFAAAAVESRP